MYKFNEKLVLDEDTPYGYIYKITNKINGKIYIGQAININTRWYHHKNNAFIKNKNQALYQAMRKYGVDNFTIEQIDSAYSKDELNKKEIYWIEKYQSYKSSNGYNRTRGGDGGDTWSNRSDEDKARTSQLLSMKLSGRSNPMSGGNAYANKTPEEMKAIADKKSKSLTGKVRSEEQRMHYRMSKIGDKNPMKHMTGDKHPNHGKKCYTSPDESESCYYTPGEEPDGWKQKMRYNLTVNRCGENNGAFGRHWYNNGERNVYEYECPEGYVKGMLKKK